MLGGCGAQRQKPRVGCRLGRSGYYLCRAQAGNHDGRAIGSGAKALIADKQGRQRDAASM